MSSVHSPFDNPPYYTVGLMVSFFQYMGSTKWSYTFHSSCFFRNPFWWLSTTTILHLNQQGIRHMTVYVYIYIYYTSGFMGLFWYNGSLKSPYNWVVFHRQVPRYPKKTTTGNPICQLPKVERWLPRVLLLRGLSCFGCFMKGIMLKQCPYIYIWSNYNDLTHPKG